MTILTLAKALNEGMRKAMEDDPKVLVMGEDVGKLGGVFRVTDGLQKDFGEDRVIDTPLAESGIIGTAIGLALRGYRPVCEIQFDGFVFPAADQIITQLAKMPLRSLGKLKLPVVVRIPCGGGIGAVEHHSESPEAYFTHTAGLRVVACSNPSDAYEMIQQAIRYRVGSSELVWAPIRYVYASISVGPCPLRAWSRDARVTANEASTSLPSIRTPGKPKPCERR